MQVFVGGEVYDVTASGIVNTHCCAAVQTDSGSVLREVGVFADSYR